MKITIIEYGGSPRQIDCESFEFRSNNVTNLIKIKTTDGSIVIKDISVIKAESDNQ